MNESVNAIKTVFIGTISRLFHRGRARRENVLAGNLSSQDNRLAVKLFRRVGARACAFALPLALSTGCWQKTYKDEAKLAGKSTAGFPQVAADVFQKMDGGIALTPDEIMGRNAWNLWSAGNEHFWNRVAQGGYEMMDLLKALDNRKYPCADRFRVAGLINQPGFRRRAPSAVLPLRDQPPGEREWRPSLRHHPYAGRRKRICLNT